jgi:hypothetical protein
MQTVSRSKQWVGQSTARAVVGSVLGSASPWGGVDGSGIGRKFGKESFNGRPSPLRHAKGMRQLARALFA